VLATELLAPFMKDAAELQNSLDLSQLKPEVRQQFEQELSLLSDKHKPDDIHFYAPLFNQDSILRYLPAHALLVLDEPALVQQAMSKLDEEAKELRAEKVADGELPANFTPPYFTWEELEPRMRERQSLALTSWGADDSSPRLDFSPAPLYAGQLPSFINQVRDLVRDKNRIIVSATRRAGCPSCLRRQTLLPTP